MPDLNRLAGVYSGLSGYVDRSPLVYALAARPACYSLTSVFPPRRRTLWFYLLHALDTVPLDECVSDLNRRSMTPRSHSLDTVSALGGATLVTSHALIGSAPMRLRTRSPALQRTFCVAALTIWDS